MDHFHSALARLEHEFRQSELPAVKRQAKLVGSPAERLQARIRQEPALRAAIDEACAQWAAGEGWPLMDPETSAFVWDRLAEARTLAQSLHPLALDAPTPEHILSWMIVDYWSLAGCCRWHARLHAMS